MSHSKGFLRDAKAYIRKWAKDDSITQDQLKSEGSPLNRNSDDWGAVFKELQRALPNEDLKDIKRLKSRIDFEKSAIRKSKKARLNVQPVTAPPSSTTITLGVTTTPQPSTSTLQPTTRPPLPMIIDDGINQLFGFNY